MRKLSICIPLVFMISCAGTFRIQRSVSKEMARIKQEDLHKQDVHLDELWPFPETISKADPYIGELGQKLASK